MTKTTKIELPAGVLKSDTQYPKLRADKFERVTHTLRFYNVTGFGWCIATLHIRNGGRSATNSSARTYAVRVSDGALVRVGMGPHVLSECTVYVCESRAQRLQKFVALHDKGASDANQTRDRISSRRAQTALRRSQWEY